ncbi:MAG: hypothetical protein NVS9B15_15890 [Acidobacteriaceae bacterium]
MTPQPLPPKSAVLCSYCTASFAASSDIYAHVASAHAAIFEQTVTPDWLARSSEPPIPAN